jgi:hypothetical protein
MRPVATAAAAGIGRDRPLIDPKATISGTNLGPGQLFGSAESPAHRHVTSERPQLAPVLGPFLLGHNLRST